MKTHNFITKATKQKPRQVERTLQRDAYHYLKAVLIPKRSKYLGHESSLGLGIMRIAAKDSAITKACKNFYNKFVISAQRKLQEKGVLKGSSDGFIFYTGGVLCLEYKVGKNKATPEQVEFASDMLDIGYPTVYPKSIDDVKKALKDFNIPNREL